MFIDFCIYEQEKAAVLTITFIFRDEIAGCIEKAYEKINFKEAARMLFFESEKPMRKYSQEVRNQISPYFFTLPDQNFNDILLLMIQNVFVSLQRGWDLKGDNYYYFDQDADKNNDDVVPATDLAQQNIHYARELEMIV